MAVSDRPAVALIAGPTASGKSALALAMADLGPITIINADSAQIYHDLRVLTARPSDDDLARAPHALFGHVDGAEACSAARWAAEARDAIDAAHEASRLPIVVGGTGLYIRTLLDGIAPIPTIDPQVRKAVRALSVAEAHDALRREDAAAAARLAPADTTRVARALEVMRSTRRSIRDWQGERQGGIAGRIALSPLLLLPPRDWLVSRCDARFAAMIESGAVAEVERLVDRRLDPALPVMRAIGVREIAAYLSGATDHVTMLEAGRLATRQYAKRQYTWFKHQLPVAWNRSETSLSDDIARSCAIKLYRRTLTSLNIADS